MKCVIEGCENKKRYSSGWCETHYRRFKTHGDVFYVTPRGINPIKRFCKNIKISGDCLEWTGPLDTNGYSHFSVNGKLQSVHRWIYEFLFGNIKKPLVIDHLCRNPKCVNPLHMEVVSNRENIIRGIGPSALNSKKTHCKRGHLLSGENVGFHKKGGRFCVLCHRMTSRRYNLKIKDRSL